MRATQIALNAISEASINQLEQLTRSLLGRSPNKECCQAREYLTTSRRLEPLASTSRLPEAVEALSKDRLKMLSFKVQIIYQDQ